MGQREERLEKLQSIIEQIDAGVIQVQIYKGMPVKVRFVSNEVILGGESILDLNEVETFSSRIWWKRVDKE